MKHISNRGPYLSSRKAANSALLLNSYKSCTPSTSEKTLIFILVFFLAWSCSFFLHCLSSSVLFLLFDMANGGAFFCLFAPAPLFTVQARAEPIWPGESRFCVGEGHCSVRTVWGRGLPAALCVNMIDISQTLPSALIGCVNSGAADSCKQKYSHWVEPQTVDIFTVDLYLILLSDHNDGFSKHKKT